jgi:hypothetical protein
MAESTAMISDLGGELVTYIPHGGTAKPFKALVERQPSQVSSTAAGSYPVNTLEVTFPMDATDGVLTVQPRKDRIEFKKNLGDSQATEFVVQKIVREDIGIAGSGGMFTVMVQA